MFALNKVVNELQKNGLSAKPFLSSDQQVEDDSIEVNDMIDVQVGYDYLCVSRWDGPEKKLLYHWPIRTKIAEVVGDVKMAMDENWKSLYENSQKSQ